MKSSSEPSQAYERGSPKLSPEQPDQVMSQMLKVHKLKPPTPRQEKTRRMMKAYLEAPIETRHLAARKAAADYERQRDRERFEAEMVSRRRYNSGVAAFCGLLGVFILPISIKKVLPLNDGWMSALRIVGLACGWALGATYVYPFFYHESGTAKPHTARLQAFVQKWRQRMCARGFHSWEKSIITKACRICGKRKVI